jgi:hypothetical protein
LPTNIAAGAGSDLATARRLSIYVSPVDDPNEESSDEESESDSENENAERDDEGMMDQGDDGYDNLDSDDEGSDAEDNAGREKTGFLGTGKASLTRRIRVGPPQNSDTSGRKVPPQVHLSKVEHMMHRLTHNISVEHVHFPPPHLQMQLGKDLNAKGPA